MVRQATAVTISLCFNSLNLFFLRIYFLCCFLKTNYQVSLRTGGSDLRKVETVIAGSMNLQM